MSKKWVLIIFGITALVMFVKPTQAVNLLTNPNFETWSSLYQPTGWTVEDTNYARIYKESTRVFAGTYAVKMKRLQVGTGNNKGLLQQVAIPGRGRYIARVRFSDNTDSCSGGMTITWRTSSGTFISSWSTAYTVNSSSWQVVERGTATDTAPTGAALADFLIRTYGTSTTPAGGTFAADSAFFDRVTAIEEEPGQNMKTTLNLEVTPNPFSTTTLINFTVNPTNFRAIKIYDATGNVVKTMNSMTSTNGVYRMNWDGRNENGVMSAPGVYFVVLETNNTETKAVKTLFLR